MDANDSNSQQSSTPSELEPPPSEGRRIDPSSHENLKAIPRRAEPGSAPLSSGQRGIWFFDQLETGSTLYNRPSNLRLSGPLNIAALERSLYEILLRHDTLRTTFVNVDGDLRQCVAPAESRFSLPVVDLRSLSELEREEEERRLSCDEMRRPLDLTKGPLFRTQLLQLNKQTHLLLLTFHHIFFDAWSMNVLVRELGACYEAYAVGKRPLLPELSIRYGDFAEWQQQRVASGALDPQLDYWKRQLNNLPALLELPTDHPRSNKRSFLGAEHILILPRTLTEKLKVFSRQHGVTLFMTFLAALQTLLYRYTSQDDIVVGLPIAGRSRAETEGLIGCFINTLVLRTDLSGRPSIRDLLQRVRKVALDAYVHQELPFEKLVKELQPDRNSSQTPFFQVMLNFRNLPAPFVETHRLKIELAETSAVAAVVDLTLDVIEKPEGLRCLFQYSTDFFEPDTIVRLMGHFHTLLQSIVANPERRLDELPLLTAAERTELLFDWNRNSAGYPRDRRLHELFEEQAARTPEGSAVLFEDQCITYRELDERANQLARYLQKLGVGPDAPVGVCLEPSAELVVALLAVLKAGGVYMPMNPAYPTERLSFMLADAGAAVLLTEEQLVPLLPREGIVAVCLERDQQAIAGESSVSPGVRVDGDNGAYVIYTSGSTGQPKGVVIPHHAICNHMYWMNESFPLAADDFVLQKTPISFDASVWEFHAPLMAGARLVMAQSGGYRDSAYLVETIRRYGITTLQTVPTLLSLLVDEAGFSQCHSLKFVFCGGEPLTPELIGRFSSRHDAELINLYGPTEATIYATYWARGRTNIVATVPIGRPISNVRAYVLDERLEPVPVGVAGQLYLGGEGLARGYWRRPQLTAEKFVPDPFSRQPGARLYRTGDRVRYHADGNIEYLGRLDHQVKLRGFRIELGEIETTLAKHPSVRKCVAMIREDDPGQSRLVAYWVATPGQSPTAGDLRSFLKDRLPEHMMPSAFVVLSELPLTSNGKLDQRALPAPNQAEFASEVFVAPRNPIEAHVASIWAEVFKVKRVGIFDNFFDLGGHSLLAAQVISRLRNNFQIELSLRSFLQSPNVAGLAEIIADAENGAKKAPPGRPPAS